MLQVDFVADCEKLRPNLLRKARRMVRSPEIAEELVQESLLKAFIYRKTFDHSKNLRNWLLRILQFTVIDSKRGNAQALIKHSLEMIVDPPDERQDPERDMGQAQERAHLNLCIGMLPKQQAQVMLLRVKGMEYPEIAAALGATKSSVRGLLLRGNSNLRKIMKA